MTQVQNHYLLEGEGNSNKRVVFNHILNPVDMYHSGLYINLLTVEHALPIFPQNSRAVNTVTMARL